MPSIAAAVAAAGLHTALNLGASSSIVVLALQLSSKTAASGAVQLSCVAVDGSCPSCNAWGTPACASASAGAAAAAAAAAAAGDTVLAISQELVSAVGTSALAAAAAAIQLPQSSCCCNMHCSAVLTASVLLGMSSAALHLLLPCVPCMLRGVLLLLLVRLYCLKLTPALLLLRAA
jgi:hypothetical protein